MNTMSIPAGVVPDPVFRTHASAPTVYVSEDATITVRSAITGPAGERVSLAVYADDGVQVVALYLTPQRARDVKRLLEGVLGG